MPRRRFSFVFKVLLFIALCLTGGSVYSLYSQLYEQNGKTESSLILVEKGDSMHTIARKLKRDGYINSVPVFKLAGRLTGEATNLKAGEYRIPAHASPKLILDILVGGQTVVRRMTIPEGLTSAQVVDMLMGTAALFGDIGEPVAPNGALLPETYVFAYGSPRRVVYQRMKDAMQKTIDELWENRNPDLPYTTVEEALTMASIVEKETSVPSERARIAGVFVNRLKKGMRLQTDPTVIYAVTNGTMELKRPLTFADLKKDHPFNTYTRKGLPPAPICNPGRESIAAALNPAETKELYFVADGTGGHAFARTFDEHRANIAAWKRKKRQKRQAALAAKRAARQKVAGSVQTPAAAPVVTQSDLVEQSEENLLSVEETLAERAPDDKSAQPSANPQSAPKAAQKQGTPTATGLKATAQTPAPQEKTDAAPTSLKTAPKTAPAAKSATPAAKTPAKQTVNAPAQKRTVKPAQSSAKKNAKKKTPSARPASSKQGAKKKAAAPKK